MRRLSEATDDAPIGTGEEDEVGYLFNGVTFHLRFLCVFDRPLSRLITRARLPWAATLNCVDTGLAPAYNEI